MYISDILTEVFQLDSPSANFNVYGIGYSLMWKIQTFVGPFVGDHWTEKALCPKSSMTSAFSQFLRSVRDKKGQKNPLCII